MSNDTTSVSKVLIDVAFKARRQRWIQACVPSSARRRLGGVASGLLGRSTVALVDDWSRPLVEAPGRPATPAAPLLPAQVVHPRRIHTPDPEVHPEAARCLLIASSLDVSGSDEMVAFLALRLRSHGFRTAVLLTPPTPKHDVKRRLAPMLSAAGVEVHVAPKPAVRQWIREWRPDVISAHDEPNWVPDEARALNVPYVKVLHGMYDLFRCDWAAEAERSRDMAAVVAVSELVRQQYLRGVSTLHSDRIFTIPNGVDDQRRVPHDRAAARAALGLENEFLFVCLARHCAQKNQYGLVSAFDEVAARHPDAHLLLAGNVGGAVYSTQVRQARERLAARDRVHLRDHASDPALVLAAADGFVLNSFFEGWALASMEALHAGVPVVASDVGGAREQLGTDPSRGYLIANPLGDPFEVNWTTIEPVCYARQPNRDELIDAMCALVRERDYRAANREQLAAESAERFDPDQCVRAHAKLLHACITGEIPVVDPQHEALDSVSAGGC